MNIHRRHLNCCIIVKSKTRRCSNTLKSSQRMGGGRIFLKTFRASLFNDTCRMSLILAGSILLDSTFKGLTKLFISCDHPTYVQVVVIFSALLRCRLLQRELDKCLRLVSSLPMDMEEYFGTYHWKFRSFQIINNLMF
jgi:hypothetical protein